MPVGADGDSDRKQSIVRAVAALLNLKPHFPKYDTNQPAFDLKEFIEDIKGALFILADLSLGRPSCYYELGIADSVNTESGRLSLDLQGGFEPDRSEAVAKGDGRLVAPSPCRRRQRGLA